MRSAISRWGVERLDGGNHPATRCSFLSCVCIPRLHVRTILVSASTEIGTPGRSVRSLSPFVFCFFFVLGHGRFRERMICFCGAGGERCRKNSVGGAPKAFIQRIRMQGTGAPITRPQAPPTPSGTRWVRAAAPGSEAAGGLPREIARGAQGKTWRLRANRSVIVCARRAGAPARYLADCPRKKSLCA